MTTHRRIFKSALFISVSTAVSRITGYFRDVTLAAVLGAGLGMDAFTIAFRISNLFRRLVGEGAMSAGFVPVLIHYQKDNTEDALWDFVKKFFYTLLLILIFLTIVIVIASPFLVRIMAPGFAHNPEKEALTIFLNRLMAPYLICIGLSALFMGILNSMNIFTLPANMPVFLNLSIIGSAFLIAPLFKEPAVGIGVGVLIGGTLQWMLQLPAVRKLGMRFKPTWPLYHPEIKGVLRLLVPTLFGVSIVQINLLIDSVFGSFLKEGSVSSLYYADRVMELVLGIFAVSLATVILPELARAARDKDYDRGSKTLAASIRLMLFITLPATAGLLALNREIVFALFRYGQFSLADGERTATALFFFGIGLSFLGVLKVIVPAFYAFKDTKTPVLGAFFALITNFILNLVLFRPLQVGGIALATSLAALVNVAFLLGRLERKYFKLPHREIWVSTLKILLASLLMGIAAAVTVRLAGFQVSGSIAHRLLPLFMAIVAAGIVYLVVCFALQIHETTEIWNFIQRKLANNKAKTEGGAGSAG